MTIALPDLTRIFSRPDDEFLEAKPHIPIVINPTTAAPETTEHEAVMVIADTLKVLNGAGRSVSVLSRAMQRAFPDDAHTIAQAIERKLESSNA